MKFSVIYYFLLSICFAVTGKEDVLYSLLSPCNGRIQNAFFSPDDRVELIIERLINAEKKGIKIAAYYLSHPIITHALIKALKRGVDMEYIGDTVPSTKSAFKSIQQLHDFGVPIWYYKHDYGKGIMHNKFMIFEENINDTKLLLTGSFNFTLNAAVRNQENIVVSDDSCMITKYENQFEKLKERCIKLPFTGLVPSQN